MVKIKSLKNIIQNFFYNEILQELTEYIENNPSEIDCISYNVDCPDEAFLENFEIKRVNIKEEPNNKLVFEVIVEAELTIAETVKRNREVDSGVQWFIISCSAVLKNGIKDFSISEIDVYNNNYVGKENNLSEYLVPIIYKEQLDDIAEDFLKKYYPEALEEPLKINTEELANRMGLSIEHLHLTKSCTVFGQIYFSDSKTRFYEPGQEIYENLEVKRGTILVDPKVFFMRNLGTVNNTIVHECFHWDRHKLFFELQNIYNPELEGITCKVREGRKVKDIKTPFDWMEWQANHAAPRILMPAKTTKEKIEELIKKNEKILPNGRRADIIESVIFELKDFFGVSIMSAKIRMIDLGYKEAEGVFNFVDNHYALNHSFELEKYKDGQTYTIKAQDALYQYAANLEFREVIDSGNYIFVDNHFCINDSKYVRINDSGSPTLTDYALQHIDECCIVFESRLRENREYGIDYYTECALFHSAISDKIIENVYTGSDNEEVVQRAKDLKDTAADIVKIKNSLPAEFSETLKFHMKRKKCTVEKLAELSLIGTKTIQRIRNEKDYPLKMEHVVALCIGLQLHPTFSKEMVHKAGFNFRGTEKQITYELLLDSYYKEPIHYCNEILQDVNLPILGTEDLE
jgi:DNA-binding Xre family transcriptional regulator